MTKSSSGISKLWKKGFKRKNISDETEIINQDIVNSNLEIDISDINEDKTITLLSTNQKEDIIEDSSDKSKIDLLNTELKYENIAIKENKAEKKNIPNNKLENNNEEFIINTEQVIYFKDLRNKKFHELLKTAEEYNVLNLNRMLKNDIICAILKNAAVKGEGLFCDGILEVLDEGFGFIRYVENNYISSAYDVYMSQNQIRKFGLRTGDLISGYVREPKRNERFFAMIKLDTINGKTFEEIKNKVNFDNLTPLFPREKLKFDINFGLDSISTRVIDLICPIGKGQRSLIVAPPRTGKTVLMQSIAHAITKSHPEVELIVLLIDERPEEVTDMQRSVKGEVVSSTFDEPSHRHVALAEMTIEKAKRMVEDGKDVVILLDSITRLARAYNAVAPSSGKILTGGVDSNALQKPKRFFGAARNIEEGGSLTIIATALIDTGSRMDEVIFEEFKGTGNSEIVLDRKIAERRVFPSLDIAKSGTRKEEEMIDKDDLNKMWILRRVLLQMNGNNSNNMSNHEPLEFLIKKLKDSENIQDFFLKMNSGLR